MTPTTTATAAIEVINADPQWRFFYRDFVDDEEETEVCVYRNVDAEIGGAVRFYRELKGEEWGTWVREPGISQLDSSECLLLYQSSLPHDHTTDVERIELEAGTYAGDGDDDEQDRWWENEDEFIEANGGES